MTEKECLSAEKIREYCGRILAAQLNRHGIPRTRPDDEACDTTAAERFMNDEGRRLVEVIEGSGLPATTDFEAFARAYAIPLELGPFRELLMTLQPDTHEAYARTRCFIVDKLTDIITVSLTHRDPFKRLGNDRRLALALVRRQFEDVLGIARAYNPHWDHVTFAQQHAGTVMFSFFVHASDLLATGDWPYEKRQTATKTAKAPDEGHYN
jgi:hypothetical protein